MVVPCISLLSISLSKKLYTGIGMPVQWFRWLVGQVPSCCVKCFNCLLSGLVGVATFQINSLFKVRHFKENRAEIRPIFFCWSFNSLTKKAGNCLNDIFLPFKDENCIQAFLGTFSWLRNQLKSVFENLLKVGEAQIFIDRHKIVIGCGPGSSRLSVKM